MTGCNCDDDMTEDGHSHACPNSITVRLAQEYARGVADERARVVAALKERAWALPKLVRQELLRAAERLERGLHEREAT